MTITTLDYSQAVSGDTDIEHADITIASGETVAQYAPLVFDSTTGHFKAAIATDESAQYLASFAVDASAAATKHRAIKAISIDPNFVAYPDTMTDAIKAGLFAGTPINVQSPQAI
jgi:hypothetical protein